MAETIAQISQPTPAPLYWGETKGYWAQTGVVSLAVIVAIIAIVTARATERKKAAAAVIFASRQDGPLVDAIRKIGALSQTDQNMAMWALDDRKGTEEAKAIRYALNHYEYVAVGIANGIYDEKLFKSSSFTTIVKLYDRTKPFIDAIRAAGQDTAQQDFECLALKWKSDPLKKKQIMHVSM